ncbi:protein tplate [Quercus suber]|uniref:Protein tplate n=1 Tax=Quercus suber TaxID=58331 RepID=A0AAW0LZ66_QUESU
MANPPQNTRRWRNWFKHFQYEEDRDSPTEVRNVLLVVHTLIAAETFQAAGVNPPSGVWQEQPISFKKKPSKPTSSKPRFGGHAPRRRALLRHPLFTIMDILYARIQADLRSNNALCQTGALLQALQQFAAGRDISILAKSSVEEIVASLASTVSKKLAFDLIRSTRLTSDLWDTIIIGVHSNLDFLIGEEHGHRIWVCLRWVC